MLGTTIGDLMQKAVGHHAGRVAVKHGDRTLTYRELGAQVNRLANALLGLGLTHGDRVALLMWNCPEYVVCDFAVATAGLVKVPLNHLLSRDDVLFRIQDSQAAAIICDAHFAPMIAELAAESPRWRTASASPRTVVRPAASRTSTACSRVELRARGPHAAGPLGHRDMTRTAFHTAKGLAPRPSML